MSNEFYNTMAKLIFLDVFFLLLTLHIVIYKQPEAQFSFMHMQQILVDDTCTLLPTDDNIFVAHDTYILDLSLYFCRLIDTPSHSCT